MYLLLLILLHICSLAPATTSAKFLKKQWAVQLLHQNEQPFTEAEAQSYALKRNFLSRGIIAHFPGYYLLETPIYSEESKTNEIEIKDKWNQVEVHKLSKRTVSNVNEEFEKCENVEWFEEQIPKVRHTRSVLHAPQFEDPLFKKQWHLVYSSFLPFKGQLILFLKKTV